MTFSGFLASLRRELPYSAMQAAIFLLLFGLDHWAWVLVYCLGIALVSAAMDCLA
jgi:hypothetical protein